MAKKSFRAADEQHAGSVKRFANGVDSFDRKIDIVDRRFFSIRRVFNRESGDAGFSAKPRVFCAPVWIVGVTVFEIGVDRKVGRFDELADVRDHVIAFHRAVR